MAGLEKKVKKAFIRYTKKHYPHEADSIIQRADELFPELYSKAPFIGGKENLMAYNLDMMIIALYVISSSSESCSRTKSRYSLLDAISTLSVPLRSAQNNRPPDPS